MKEIKLEHKWEKSIDKAIIKNGSMSLDGFERSWKIYFQYFFEYYLKKIKDINLKSSVLDVGCGSGVISKELARLGFEAYGVDFSKEVVKVARRYAPTVDFQRSPIYKLPFPNESFDVVVCLGVLQTVADPSRAIKEMARTLKKDGVLIIRTLNTFAISSFRGKNSPIFTFYSPLQLKKILSKEGFKNISIKGIYICPKFLEVFTRIILWSKIYRWLNVIFFPIFIFLSHSFYIDGVKK